ncbi:two-component system phosphate regulon sensor histidine kinase PhoR [Dysgonomonas sp. PH5-45]|uniref:ATP-binding protein n=1 Tax=unclassified Dysgonomonas TaxID=2630389 RepID=UPI0024763FD8|nr:MULTISPECIES: ATP-binding protein [unclassified Dysgonomonas]MDH6353885.1 two-component system phosphate regulon sensor histidine kinase PhoR [Dysgonomonas sp. PH5-45]MDH6386787.1 two-component system phosphate regulon sensor histidine kinase PhoR [Dysgonomonas sp. PH5-37]
MKTTYKQRLSLYFFLIFALFTIGIIVFEQSRETKFRTEALEEKLDAYTGIIQASMNKYTESPQQAIDSLSGLLPENLRMTLIDRQGNVISDNAVGKKILSENHAERPEVLQAKTNGKGSHIRTSATNNQKYLYYAKRTNNYFIRVAFPYDIQVHDFLKSDNLFLYYILVLFVITLLLINYVADRFGKSIKKLKEFALGENEPEKIQTEFPEDELGVIGRKIVDNYKQIKEREKEITLEREKLLQHVHSSGEGLCFFSADREVGLYNGLFIQYLNTITDESVSDPTILFTDTSFVGISDFLSGAVISENYYETQINKQGKHFNIRVNVFEDRSFEIIINDITKQEKTRLLKQEMTSNIAHELRTPVTSIRGFLEIALEQSVDAEAARNFLTKAHEQTIVLSELIQDMSLITKIEEAPSTFKQEDIHLEELLHSLKEDLNELLSEKNIDFQWSNMANVIVRGNRNLLYSIFRNLTDNAIRYAGRDITITVNKYNEDKDFYHFSYSDTGIGIDDERHLNRIFERFYRVNEGRTRDTGGSGLGLSIVKNAVLFHKGTIIVKNRAGGGLEFLFKLSITG